MVTIDDLNWEDDESNIDEEATYLVDTKHGLVEASWRPRDQVWGGYMFSDFEVNGYRWVKL